MTAGVLDSQLKTMSEIHRWLNLFYSHQFQYSSGKMLDESVLMPCLFVAGNADMKQLSGFVSEAQQNVIMNHATSSTFIKYYHTQCHDDIEWSEKQTVIDIKQQLSGSAVDKTAWQIL
uniref:Uncharacterized protein n=1 Tax=Coccidioides posadasii RMSCC 3488 TaxID=454284 RepID=A0A0J6FLB7_COCPO|nr:hypothetical protein CPAG_07415 [Coccidioides posadasii RMSCC 3488]